MERIVLVTGSRNWIDDTFIFEKLQQASQPGRKMVLVHGACPSGADAIAHKFATTHSWEIRTFPSDWSFGKKDRTSEKSGDGSNYSTPCCACI